MQNSKGFTLIELLITIAVLAIILAFAVPSFVNLIENSRVTTQSNTLLGAINLARSEAVKQGFLSQFKTNRVVLSMAGASFPVVSTVVRMLEITL